MVRDATIATTYARPTTRIITAIIVVVTARTRTAIIVVNKTSILVGPRYVADSPKTSCVLVYLPSKAGRSSSGMAM